MYGDVAFGCNVLSLLRRGAWRLGRLAERDGMDCRRLGGNIKHMAIRSHQTRHRTGYRDQEAKSIEHPDTCVLLQYVEPAIMNDSLVPGTAIEWDGAMSVTNNLPVL